MYNYPERKKYKYVIRTKRGKVVLKFEQATAQETLDYLEMVNGLYDEDIYVKIRSIEQIKKYYIDFIVKSSSIKRYNIRKRVLLLYVFGDLDRFINEIVLLLHPTRKSIYIGTEIPKINGKAPRAAMFVNQDEAISKNSLIPIDEIRERLTYEQYQRYLDKIVYNSYESFDEGKAINDSLSKKINKKNGGLSEEDKADLEIIKSQTSFNK